MYLPVPTFFIGNVDEGLEQSDTVVKRSYKTSIVQHCHIENPISFAYMEKGRIVVVTSTQIPHIVRRVIGQALGIPWGRVRVIKPYIGGGFGNKQDVLYEPLNAFLTTQVGGRPVKLEVSREENPSAIQEPVILLSMISLQAWIRKVICLQRYEGIFQPGGLSVPWSRHCRQRSYCMETSVCLPKYQRRGLYHLYQYPYSRSHACLRHSSGRPLPLNV